MSEKPGRSTASGYYINQVYRIAARAGVDADALLASVGLSLTGIEGEARVPTEALAAMIEAFWDEVNDEAMMLSKSKIPRGSLYLMGKLAVGESTLESALLISKRFIEVVSKTYSVELKVDDDLATLKFQLSDPELDHEHMLAEYILLHWHRLSSWLIAENIALIQTSFHYPAPDQINEYAYLFPGEHQFNADGLCFSFDPKYLQRPVVQNTDSLESFIKRCPEELFVRPQTDFSLSSEIRVYLQRRMKDGLPGIEQAASDLNMTKRTMIRRLKEEGSAYQYLKDQVRRDRAIKLLIKRNLLIGDVAEQLGFSDSAVFARAFKAWTGYTPKAYKERHVE